MDFWDFFWLMIYSFFFIAYLMVMFQIIVDVFRDTELSGVVKAVWMIALIFLPVLTAIVYLIARGKGMAERQVAAAQQSRAQADDYIRSVAGSSGGANPAEQIAQAKALLESGHISQEEFQALKAKALA
jgi:Phospholipase_D-nuclease N-terminal/Short C-terminal domain